MLWDDNTRMNNQRLFCDKTFIVTYIIQVIPFILRALHAFNFVIYNKTLCPHLANTFRFILSAVTITLGFLYSRGILINAYIFLDYINLFILIACQLVSYLYNLYWDYFISWQVFQKNAKYFLIRDVITYPRWFYYFVIFLNFFLRASWSLTFLPIKGYKDLIFFIMCLIEVFRKILWLLLRIENESHNNPEKFRKFIPVPEVTDDTQNIIIL